MALTIAQKSGIRRHLGYPAIGLLRVSPVGGTLASAAAGWRFFEAFGFLEYKMNNLNPDEEARLIGAAMGGVALTGPQPDLGDVLSVTFAGGGLVSPVTVSTTAPAPNPNVDNRVTLINGIAGQVSINETLQNASFFAAAPYGTGPVSQNAVAIAEVGITCPTPFTLTCSGTGATAPQVTATGGFLSPSAQLAGTRGPTLWGYLPILDGLESAYAGASSNLDTAKADVWSARLNELGQRTSLYEVWVDKMSDFLQVPRNSRRMGNPARRGAMSYA